MVLLLLMGAPIVLKSMRKIRITTFTGLCIRKWDLVKAEVLFDRVVIQTQFDSSKYPHIYDQFPHHFIVRMTYLIEGQTVHKNATIINQGLDPFPWGLVTILRFCFLKTHAAFP
jgi:aldose 1-epimerase